MGCCASARKEEKDPLLPKNKQGGVTESNKAQAVKDYNAKNSTEISFKSGDILDIVDKTQKGYWMGQVEGQSVFGWFPSACVILIDEKEAIFKMEKQRIAGETLRRKQSEMNLSKEVSAQSLQKAMTVNTAGKVLNARALKSYAGKESTFPISDNTTNYTSFIAFAPGDVVVVTDKSRADWWLGHLEGQTNTWGWFPADYVEIISSS